MNEGKKSIKSKKERFIGLMKHMLYKKKDILNRLENRDERNTMDIRFRIPIVMESLFYDDNENEGKSILNELFDEFSDTELIKTFNNVDFSNKDEFSTSGENIMINGGKITGSDTFDFFHGVSKIINTQINAETPFNNNGGIISLENSYSNDSSKFPYSYRNNSGIFNITKSYIKGGEIFDSNHGIFNIYNTTIEGPDVAQNNHGFVELNNTTLQDSGNPLMNNAGFLEIENSNISGNSVLNLNRGYAWVNNTNITGRAGIGSGNYGEIYMTDVSIYGTGIFRYNYGVISAKKLHIFDCCPFHNNNGVIEIYNGEIQNVGNPFYENMGFVKISKDTKFIEKSEELKASMPSNSIADNMKGGFLYVLSNDVEIGNENENVNKDDSIKGLIIAPNGLKFVYNPNMTVFTAELGPKLSDITSESNEEKYHSDVVIFRGNVNIGNTIHNKADILEELGNYIWRESTSNWNNKNEEERYELVNKISSKWKSKHGKIYMSELFKDYDYRKGKDIGKFVYEKLTSDEGLNLLKVN